MMIKQQLYMAFQATETDNLLNEPFSDKECSFIYRKGFNHSACISSEEKSVHTVDWWQCCTPSMLHAIKYKLKPVSEMLIPWIRSEDVGKDIEQIGSSFLLPKVAKKPFQIRFFQMLHSDVPGAYQTHASEIHPPKRHHCHVVWIGIVWFYHTCTT